MNNPNPEVSSDTTPVEETPVAVVNAPAPIDSRRRLRELLSVPERDRTDEQWDEIIELEIQLAPGNRISPNDTLGGGGSTGGSQGRGKPRAKTGGPVNNGGPGGQQQKHRPRTNNNRRPRQNKPPVAGGGGAA